MRKLPILLCLLPLWAHTQTINGTATVSWTPPTLSVSGLPLTENASITEYRLYVDKTSIPDAPTTQAIVISANATQTVYTTPVLNGETLFFRLSACNINIQGATVCSDLSNQASRRIVVDTTPGAPTNVDVIITIG